MATDPKIRQKVDEFKAKLKLVEETENVEESPYNRLVYTAMVHQKFRGHEDLNIVYRLGYDELSRFLDSIETDFSRSERLKKILCLADRVHGNYRAAMICYINGLDQTAFDIMRDVMEITYLVRDFVLYPDHIEEWADGTEKNRRNRFTSGKLRKRFADHLGIETGDLMDTKEYNSHSGMLHVNPEPHILLQRGICKDRQPEMSARFALADIFHHAKDVSFIFTRLMNTLSIAPTCDPATMDFLPWAHSFSRMKFDDVMEFVNMASEMAPEDGSAKIAT